MNKRLARTAVLCACIALLLSMYTYADNFAIVTTRTGNDTIDWGQLGVTFTTIASPASWTWGGRRLIGT